MAKAGNDIVKNSTKRGGVFSVLQRIGKSFMFPIALLPVAGLLLGVGSSFTNETMIESYNLQWLLGDGTILNFVLSIMSKTGSIIFDNLPIIFAMGVGLGMAEKEKEVSTLSSAIAYLIMIQTISILLNLTGGITEQAKSGGSITQVLGIWTLNMGVFGGIIVGLGVAALHNRFYKIKLPSVISFFGGNRFVPIISTFVFILVGVLMFFVWPYIQAVIYSLGGLVLNSGLFGTFIYGIIERALIPFGLHHVFYLPFWQTGLGGSMNIDGQLIQGAQNIFFAQLASPSTTQFSVDATRFMAGKFPFMIFGLPGAALAMYKCALPEKRKEVGGLLLSAALTAMVTGITEPLEFTFLFVAPVLYGIHCVLCGLSFMLMNLFNVGVGMTFSGGFIDLFLFGILQGNSKTNWIFVPLVGIFYFVIYYFLFSFVIKKFNLMTPGRDISQEVKLYSKKDYLDKKGGQNESRSALILSGLGGNENISNIDSCATRLRITVKDETLVKRELLKQSGAVGVLLKGNGVQVIYGPQANVIRSEFEDYVSNGGKPASEDTNLSNNDKPVDDKVDYKGETHTLKAFASGDVVEIEKVPDDVFAQKVLGEGVAINLKDGNIYSPANGEIVNIAETKHAYCITTDDGLELLIHIGIDTVKLKGKGFDVKVNEKDKVKVGDLLAKVDLDYLKEQGCELYSPLVLTNKDVVSKFKPLSSGSVSSKDDIVEYDI